MADGKTLNDQAHEAIALDVAESFAILTHKYRHNTAELAFALTDSLGAYIALHSPDPAKGLMYFGERLKLIDFAQIRLRHSGFKLGLVEDEQEPGKHVAIGLHMSHQKPE